MVGQILRFGHVDGFKKTASRWFTGKKKNKNCQCWEFLRFSSSRYNCGQILVTEKDGGGVGVDFVHRQMSYPYCSPRRLARRDQTVGKIISCLGPQLIRHWFWGVAGSAGSPASYHMPSHRLDSRSEEYRIRPDQDLSASSALGGG